MQGISRAADAQVARTSPLSESPRAAPVVVMGVCGCGKSSLAALLAEALGWPFIEGDEFHSENNKSRMRAGIALTDKDRASWLRAIGGEFARYPQGAVFSCSALKRRYRDLLRTACPRLRFVYLDIDEASASRRVQARAAAHFIHPSLVTSQFAALELPVGEPGVLWLDATMSPSSLRDAALQWLASPKSNIQHPCRERVS